MLKYAILFLFAVSAFAGVPCCEEREHTKSYLDIAIDLISKAKSKMPRCEERKECPEVKKCPEAKTCPETQECSEVKECSETMECPETKATDCADWYDKGHNKSGVYSIWPISRLTSNKSIDVFCDMDTDGGGWTVIQRRENFSRPDDYFYKDWNSYKQGFGSNDNDFWLGNDNIFALTNQKLYSIRFDLQDKDLVKAYAKYSDFWIDDELNKYAIHISNYSGNAGNSMRTHNNTNFTTKDQKNDGAKENCAVRYKGGWWYRNCYDVNLNGLYNVKERGISWAGWRNSSLPSLIWTEMKIRPKSFTPFSLV